MFYLYLGENRVRTLPRSLKVLGLKFLEKISDKNTPSISMFYLYLGENRVRTLPQSLKVFGTIAYRKNLRLRVLAPEDARNPSETSLNLLILDRAFADLLCDRLTRTLW